MAARPCDLTLSVPLDHHSMGGGARVINKEDRLGEREGDVGTVGKMDGVRRDRRESAQTQVPEG